MKTINLDICSAGRIVALAVFFYCFFISSLPSIVQAAEGDLEWAFGFGQSGQNLSDIGYKIFVDSVGNVYTTGYFQGMVDFDPGPGTENLTSVADRDIFVTKMSSSGSLVWAKKIGGSGNDEGWSITVDAFGNVITTGYFVGTVDFDPNGGGKILNGGASGDIFISKLDRSGNYVGAWSMGGNIADWGFGIFVDPTGNIYTTGYFQNDLVFNPGNVNTGLTSAGGTDIFISKLNSNGTFAWAKRIGGSGTDDDEGLGISHYSSGHVYVTGWFQGTNIDFDSDASHAGNSDKLSSAGNSDVFVLKLADDGSFVWARAMGGGWLDEGQAVSVDSSGNVYSTGLFMGTADFDRDNTHNGNVDILISPNAFDADIFVSKLDSNGNFVWAKSMGGSSSADVGYGIAVDGSRNVFTTGSFQGTDVDFDPGEGSFLLDSAGNEDIFISKLDSSGNFVWAKHMGGTLEDRGYDIFVDRLGTVYTTGYLQGTADFDPDNTHAGDIDIVISAGSNDIFICKLAGRDPFPWAMFLPAIIGNRK